MWILSQPDLLLENFRREYRVGLRHGQMLKQAGSPTKSYALSGELYLSDSNWLLLRVPNSLIRGVYDAINEPGVELPLQSSGRLVGHVSVMSKDEVEGIGAEHISERGHHFTYTLGPLKTVKPNNWNDVSMVYYVTVESPELKKLRQSYGLESQRNGYDFHITVGIRRKGVTGNNEVSKTVGEKSSSAVAFGAVDDLMAMYLARQAAAKRQAKPLTEPVKPEPLKSPPVDTFNKAVTGVKNFVAPMMPASMKSAVFHRTQSIQVPRRDKLDKIVLCPHCGVELANKDIYTDNKGWHFCRKCLLKGKGSILLPAGFRDKAK